MRVRARALALAVALAHAGAPAHADARAEEPAVEDALAEAEKHHLDADAKYNTADYDGAIKAWQKAFAALPRTAEGNPYRSLILYNIAAAQEKLFALRGDVEYLKQAKILLERFEASIDETYAGAPEDGEKERAQVKAKIASIDEQIAAANRDTPAAEPANEPPHTEPATPSKAGKADAPPRASDRSRGLFIGGGVLVGLGVVGAAGMTAALVVGEQANDLEGVADDDLDQRKDRFDRGRRANAGAIAAGAIGAVCLAAGIALIAAGAKRRSSRTAIAPVVGRGFAGVSFGGRF